MRLSRVTEQHGLTVPGSTATLTIDCATCVMRDTSACRDCVVTFICDRDPHQPLVIDRAEGDAVRMLGRAGLVPRLRHATAATAGDGPR